MSSSASANVIDNYVSFITKANGNQLFANPFTSSSSDLKRLTKTMTHTGHNKYPMDQEGNDQIPALYETVHLHYPPPPQLQPITPKQLVQQTSVQVRNDEARRAASPLPSPLPSPVASRTDSPVRYYLDEPSHSPSLGVAKHLKSALSKPGRAPLASAFRTLVSFDTVNIGFSDDATSDNTSRVSALEDRNSALLDEEFGLHSDRRTSGSSRWRSPSPSNRDISPTSSTKDLSPTTGSRELSPPNRLASSGGRSRSPARASSIFRKYPTTPIITHDSCTLTKKHRQFDRLYSGALKPRTAVLPNRNILCYVSGRKHTWVAVDWCCNQLLEDGDTLVIIASIRPNWRSSLRRRLSSGSIFAADHSLMTEEGIRRSPEYAKVVTENLMKYALAILNSNKIIKITVELSVGNTKDVLKDMYSLYMPSVVVTSAKPTAAPSTKSWLTSRITDRLVKNFAVPVVIVPAINMDLFQLKLYKVLDKRMQLAAKGKADTKELLDELQNVGMYDLGDQRNYLRQSAAEDLLIKSDLEEFGLEKEREEEEEDDDDDDNTDTADEHSDKNSSVDSEEDGEEVNDGSNAGSPAESSAGNRTGSGDESDFAETTFTGGESRSRPMHLTRSLQISQENPALRHLTLLRSKTEDASENKISTADGAQSLVSDKKESTSFQLKKLEFDTQIRIYKEMNTIEHQPVTEDTFKHFLGVVSDVAYNYGIELAEYAKEGGEGANMVRTMTGAPDVSYFRPKSMLLGKRGVSSTPFVRKSVSNSDVTNSVGSPGSAESFSPGGSRGSRGSRESGDVRALLAPTIKVDSPEIRAVGEPIVSSYSEASGKHRASSLRFDLGNGASTRLSGKNISGSPDTLLRSVYSAGSTLHPGVKVGARRKSFFKRLFNRS
ncbi:hypothetical protein FOA43_002504 [Brettanomyces nanus]|uniref:Uncharacterized protein n=1 Tax=Eeniella nana TaxID=13502 RepID=A0A875S5Y9_EENNA|nr:uncharacterized protein FOA43_002504 [Brettanomyces nanus]QPG75159.1 hypothetical protein FOA43_002504 [Brettanomyces nanus]